MTASSTSHWQGRFFRRIFSRVGVLLAVGMALVCVLTWEITQQGLRGFTESQLQNNAELAEIAIRQGWPYPSSAALIDRCQQMSKRTGLRVTVIDAGGTVLGESDSEPAHMQNHAGRPEVAAALSGRVGLDRRTSASVGRPFQYVAVPMRIDGRIAAVVRVASPVEAFQRREAVLVKWVAAGLAVSLPLALFIAFIVSRALAEPVQHMGRMAQRLATGDLSTRVEASGDDEVRQVADSLERMRVNLADRIHEAQQQRQDLEVTLGNLEEGVIAVNAQGVVLSANAAARRLLEPSASLVGWPLTVGLGQGALSGLWSEAVRASAAELRRDVELNGAGTRRTVNITITRVHDSHTPIAWLLCVRDITELARSAAMKADFVANASHELRTPVTAIRAAVETLRGDGLEAAVRERFMSVIDRNVERLSNLTEDLMQLNRVEATAPELKRTTFAAEEVVSLMIASYADRLRDKAAAARFEGQHVTVNTDRRWLELILKNLIDNAAKFIGQGGWIVVRCSAERERILFEVEDNGCGIAAEDLDRVFERFYQVDKSRGLNTGGTGLGLAIVKHAVHGLGGDVSMRSEYGRGTTVTFWFPQRGDGK